MGADLTDICEKIGKQEVCIEVVKRDILELKERPGLPRWICRAASGITVGLVVAVLGAAAAQAVNWYRLSQVEQAASRNTRRFDRMIGAIADELASARTESETTSAASPAARARHGRVPAQPSKTTISYSGPSDTLTARRILKRIQARIDGGS